MPVLRMEDILEKLPLILESDHFIVRFALRNPQEGRGEKRGGVRNQRLLLAYLDALERLYATMTEGPWKRYPPNTGGQGKTLVFVFDTSEFLRSADCPFTSVDHKGIPFIGLPYQNNEPIIHGELQRAAVEAIHEATHVFNFRERPLLDPQTGIWDPAVKLWVWFDDAMAVFMETLVLSGCPEHLRFIMEWSDRPDMPLDGFYSRYQSSMFVRYLGRRMGLEFINRVWTESKRDEIPIQALDRLLRQENLEFSSSNPEIRDIFASGYCMDSYFLIDPRSPGFAPEVYERFRERAISESFLLGAGKTAETEGCLDHLACQYYRLYVMNSVKAIQVQLETKALGGDTPLKAEIATVTDEMQRGKVRPLKRTTFPGQDDTVQLSTVLNETNLEDIDHLVLVVSNCGVRAVQEKPGIEHDDQQEYKIVVAAY